MTLLSQNQNQDCSLYSVCTQFYDQSEEKQKLGSGVFQCWVVTWFGGSELALGLIFETSSRIETKFFGEELELEPDSRSTVVGRPPNTHVFLTVACFLSAYVWHKGCLLSKEQDKT